MAFSIVILSKSAVNLAACLGAIRVAGEISRAIVVDDGVDWECYQDNHGPPVQFIRGEKPFIFSRNVNFGVQAVGEDDVIILGDDVLLKTSRGFSQLWEMAKSHPEFGLISSSCNNVGNMNMHPQGPWVFDEANAKHWPVDVHRQARPDEVAIPLREDPRQLCFVSVLIPRSTIDLIGGLDTRFVHYGMDDDDYSLRARLAGLKLGIWDGCFVDHHTLQSTYRTPSPNNSSPGDFKPNLKLFIRKWGTDNWGKKRNESPFSNLFPEGRWPCEHCSGSGRTPIASNQPCRICSGLGCFQ